MADDSQRGGSAASTVVDQRSPKHDVHASGAMKAPGQQRLFRQVYEQHWSDLCGYIYKKFGAGPPEPEDVAQMAFTKFCRLDEPEKIENPKAFLMAMARNIVIDDYRKTGRRQMSSLNDETEKIEENLYELSPERVLLDRERFELVAEALKKLPVQRRRMILLNRYEGLSCKDIALRFGMSPAAVQKQIERGLAQCLVVLDRTVSREE